MLQFSHSTAFRGYATLKDIQIRLKSIKNIGKITKSMKMIAATKMNRAQKAMEMGRTYGMASTHLINNFGLMEKYGIESKLPEKKFADIKELFLTCSSDRGLCGAIHSSVSKLTRRHAKDAANASIVVLGDKAKPQIARDCRKLIDFSFSQVSKSIPTFSDAIAILSNVQKQGIDLTKVSPNVIYNRFTSVIAYETTLMKLPTLAALKDSPKLALYEIEDDILDNFMEFVLCSKLFWGLAEGHASEMAAKRTAMENATKNSEEIVQSLTMLYNRTRQAVITNELVDIITGASAL